MWIGIISIFPEMFDIIVKYGIIGKAFKKKLIDIKVWNPRDFSNKKNRKIDKKPYGGGAGMLMEAEPVHKAIKAAMELKKNKVKTIYLSPKGKKINQDNIYNLLSNKNIILVCGRYKGIDERIILQDIDEELSIGDYIVSGGEIPAMVLIDAITRLIPGVLNKESSIKEDSFYYGLLDCPHYTKPKIYNNIKVPSILLSGNHKNIKRWKLKQSLGITFLKRPELFKKIKINKEKINLLIEYLDEFYKNK